jgi:DNA invertase Pin-like site-specific DNA recombinase
MSKRAYVYCRISQDREGRRIGVGRQEEDCHALAERLSYTVADVFIDNDISASTRSRRPRPRFEEMMRLAEQGAVQAVLSYSSGRLTRRPLESERLIRLYEDHQVLIHYVNASDNDLSTARGRSRARDDARRDAEEVEEMSERVARDTVRRAKEGISHGGHRPFGWTSDGKLHPYESPILLDLIERALAGESLKALGRSLEEAVVPGARWHPPLVLKGWPSTTIRQMLTNPRLAGLRVHQGQVVGKATWDALVGEETWRQLCALFADPSRTSGRYVGRVHLLVGLARCAECDRRVASQNVHGSKPRKQYKCDHCRLYRSMAAVDTYVEAAIVRVLEEYSDAPDSMDPEVLRSVERLRARIESTKEKFADDDTMTPFELRDILRSLRKRLEVEESKLVKSRRPKILHGVVGPAAAKSWGSLSLDRKRAIIDSMVEVRIKRVPPGPRSFDPDSVDVVEK